MVDEENEGGTMTRSLYVLRHGETLFNVQRKTQGWCDSPLTARGIEQARIAGRTLAARGLVFDRFLSSTSERCCDTLELAVEAGWGEVPRYERDKGLKEFNFGAFEAKDQFLERFPHGDFYLAYGGDSEHTALARFSGALDRIMAQGGERVLVVSHGGVGINFFRAVVPNPEPGTVPFGNCICYHYEYDEARAGQGVGAFSWVETIVPDFSALDDPDLPPQVTWR
jgi:probable phosphoglycerate mutase